MIDVGDKGKIGGHFMIFLKPHSSPCEACCSHRYVLATASESELFCICKMKEGNQNGITHKLEKEI